MRAVIYCRVSTKEQTKNLSLFTQKKACLEYCLVRGISVDRVFVEEGESAKTVNRTEFQNLLSYCKEQAAKIDYVIVYKVDRFARSNYDHQAVRVILSKLNINLRSVTEPFEDDPTGKLMENILASFSQFDNEMRAERTITGMQAAYERGRWVHRAPLGYINGSKEGPSLLPDLIYAPIIKQAFEMMSTGRYGQNEVLHKLTASGLRTRKGKKINPQSFRWILRNPIYIGRIVIPKRKIDVIGDFEPIVDEGTFKRVQRILSGKTLPTNQRHLNNPDFPLRRFVNCAQCGTPLTGSWSKGRKIRYAYYRCRNSACKAISVPKSVLEDKFIDLLQRLQPCVEYSGLYREILFDAWKQRQSLSLSHKRSLEQRIQDFENRKHTLVEAFLYKQSIDEDTYQEQLSQINKELDEARLELLRTKPQELDIKKLSGFAYALLNSSDRLWRELDIEMKLRLQTVIFPNGIKYDGIDFGTAETGLIFNILAGNKPQKTKMVGDTGFEPVTSTV